jgi:predicted nuclease of predicted toxin-antitoxin system
MKFKLDENFGTRTQQIFRSHGHDVLTVRDQNLQGCADQRLYDVCCTEQRCLVTLDLDFSDVLRFPSQQAYGIVVIRVPHNPTLPLLEQLVRQFLNSLETMSVDKKLWIVETGRIRVHQAEDAESEKE